MRKELTFIIAIGLIIGLFLTAILVYLGFDIVKKTDFIKGLRSEVNSRSQIAEALSFSRSDINKVQSYTSMIESFLPNKDQLLGLTRDLNTIAVQNNVNLTAGFSEESSKTVTDLKWIGVNINSEGDLGSLINFMKTMENSRYLIKSNSLDLVKGDKGFKLSINSRVFYY